MVRREEVLDELLLSLDLGHSSVDSIVSVISRDEYISSQILKLANSAYYSLPYKITSLKQAVTLMGYDSVINIVMDVYGSRSEELQDTEQVESEPILIVAE